jgi:hypothetical protein
LNRKIASELLWWSMSIIYNTPFDFAARPSQATLTTDAAEAGWGAALSIGTLFWTTSGFFQPTDNLTSSNQRETAAVLRALKEYMPLLEVQQIRAITIQSDNMTTVCNLARQSCALTLLKLTRAIFSLLTRADVRIKAIHIPGKGNTLADSLSRLDFAGDYALKKEIYDSATTVLQVLPTVDVFATNLNQKCSRFFAPAKNQNSAGAAAIDGLAQPWELEILPYLHPPIPIIPQVLQKIQREKVRAVMVVPYWPGHSWWSMLLPMVEKSLNLGKTEDVLIRGTSSNTQLTKLPLGEMLMCVVSFSQ